jgi:hypothetical protein
MPMALIATLVAEIKNNFCDVFLRSKIFILLAPVVLWFLLKKVPLKNDGQKFLMV